MAEAISKRANYANFDPRGEIVKKRKDEVDAKVIRYSNDLIEE